MTKRFALSDKDFDSCRVGITGQKNKALELISLEKDMYLLLMHHGDSVEEVYEFTYEEIKALWMMLTIDR